MAENPEEAIDGTENTPSEKPAEEITPTYDTKTVNPNQETENMEVHKHPHHITHKKKWGEYFLEFLMLFLAVFLGFLAEYQLEHIVEGDREKAYIQSMIEDLETDASNLSEVIIEFGVWNLQVDTVLKMYPKLAKGYNDTLYRNMILMQGFPDFIYTDRTMQQLKNSGNMRLIRRKAAANGIMDYDSKIRDLIVIDQPSLAGIFEKYISFWNELIDVEAIENDKHILTIYEMEKGGKNYLLKTDKASLGNLNNTLRDFKLVSERDVQVKEIKLKEIATRLIKLLKKEYHL